MIEATNAYIYKRFGVADTGSDRVVLKHKREDLALMFGALECEAIAEIGVMKGYFSESLCSRNPNCMVYSIDPWAVNDRYLECVSEREMGRFMKKAVNRLSKYKNCTIIRKFSVDAIADFADASLDGVYIDANHLYDACIEDLRLWSPKVKKGGIVSGHDYGREAGNDMIRVKEAVDDYTKEMKIPTVFITSELSSSYFWVKQ